MRHIIDTPEGSIIISHMIENCCDPFDFFFELDSIPQLIDYFAVEAPERNPVPLH